MEETPRERAEALERENRELRKTVEGQAAELETLRRRVAELEERGQELGKTDAVEGSEGQLGEWRPPCRGHGLPDGVVTLAKQPDEEHAFGAAVPLVAETANGL